MTTKIDKLLNLLSKGKEVTAKQIRSRTGLASPSAAVRDLRAAGYEVDSVPRYVRGEIVHKYRMTA